MKRPVPFATDTRSRHKMWAGLFSLAALSFTGKFTAMTYPIIIGRVFGNDSRIIGLSVAAHMSAISLYWVFSLFSRSAKRPALKTGYRLILLAFALALGVAWMTPTAAWRLYLTPPLLLGIGDAIARQHDVDMLGGTAENARNVTRYMLGARLVGSIANFLIAGVLLRSMSAVPATLIYVFVVAAGMVVIDIFGTRSFRRRCGRRDPNGADTQRGGNRATALPRPLRTPHNDSAFGMAQAAAGAGNPQRDEESANAPMAARSGAVQPRSSIRDLPWRTLGLAMLPAWIAVVGEGVTMSYWAVKLAAFWPPLGVGMAMVGAQVLSFASTILMVKAGNKQRALTGRFLAFAGSVMWGWLSDSPMAIWVGGALIVLGMYVAWIGTTGYMLADAGRQADAEFAKRTISASWTPGYVAGALLSAVLAHTGSIWPGTLAFALALALQPFANRVSAGRKTRTVNG